MLVKPPTISKLKARTGLLSKKQKEMQYEQHGIYDAKQGGVHECLLHS